MGTRVWKRIMLDQNVRKPRKIADPRRRPLSKKEAGQKGASPLEIANCAWTMAQVKQMMAKSMKLRIT